MDVGGWLRSLGLEQYEAAFRENAINQTILPSLTAEDLKDLGVGLVGHRRQLLDAIAALHLDVHASAPPPLHSVLEGSGEESAERRQVTIMFCDLVGSTALSARLDPEDMREVIRIYQRCCTEVITKAGGFVAKYMGDGALAYFGYPHAHEDDAEQAVRSALALLEAIPKLRPRRDVELQVRIGIDTGLVVVGDLIGKGISLEHSVVGDAPNLASRLQALAGPGQVVISHSARRLTGGLFEYRDLGQVALKGLSDPVQAWRVLGPSGVQSRFEAQHATSLMPLVGREEELELLLRRSRQATGGEGRVVLISGEPGIGKSRIVSAIEGRLKSEPYGRLRYFCSPHHIDSALHPIILQLERAANFVANDTAETKVAKLESLLESTSPSADDTALIAELLSIATTGPRPLVLDLPPHRRKQLTFQALLHQLERLARGVPLLMIYEDVHWIDPTSRELLDLTVERVKRLPILLLITFRTEMQPRWVGQAHVTLLALNRLDRNQGAALVKQVAGQNELSNATLAKIVERTDGVPLFLEEMTRAVIESGEFRDQSSSFFGRQVPPSIPATLQASLLARLDRLGPDARQVAQIGAALGREFSYELLAAVAQAQEDGLRESLAQLVAAGLLFERGAPPQSTYLFKHALVQDAAYDTLLRGVCQSLHTRIAEVFENKYPETVDTRPELLAHHFAQAGLTDKAVQYHLQAGQLALKRGASSEGIAQLRRGLDLIDTLPENHARKSRQLTLLVSLSEALISTSHWTHPDLTKIQSRSRKLSEELNETELLVDVLDGQYGVRFASGETAPMLDAASAMLRAGQKEGSLPALYMGHRTIGITLELSGEPLAARKHLEEAIALSEDAPNRSRFVVSPQYCRSTGLCWLAWTLMDLGYADQARHAAVQARNIARKAGQPFTLCNVLNNCSRFWIATSDLQSVEQVLDEFTDLSEKYGFMFYIAFARIYRGLVNVKRGRVGEGGGLLKEGIDIQQLSGDRSFESWRQIQLAQFKWELGEFQQALVLVDEALAGARHKGQGRFEWESNCLRGKILASLPQPDYRATEDCLRCVIESARHGEAKFWELRASTSLARLWGQQGKRAEARELLAPIYNWFTEGLDTPDLMEAKALLNTLASA